MKKFIWGCVLVGAASAASAQIPVVGDAFPSIQRTIEDLSKQLAAAEGIPVVDVAGQEAELRSKAQAVLLQGVYQQLVEMNVAIHQDRAARTTPARMCRYEDKSYSEGAILPVGATLLTCVERDRVVRQQDKSSELVWAPRNIIPVQ